MTNNPNPDDLFTPETVDERIEQLLQDQNIQAHPHALLAHELHHLYQENAAILQRARKRLFQDSSLPESTLPPVATPQDQPAIKQVGDHRRYHHMQLQPPRPGRIGTNRFPLLAAVAVFALLLIGSMAGFAYFANHTAGRGPTNNGSMQPGSQPTMQKTPSGVYISTNSSFIRMDTHSGKVIWTYKLPHPYKNESLLVVPAGDKVFLAFTDATSEVKQPAITALDAQNGQERWSHSFDSISRITDLTVVNDMVYSSVITNVDAAAEISENIVYAFNAADGQEHSHYQFDGERIYNIAIADGLLYRTTNHTLGATRLSDGKQLWLNQIHNKQQAINHLLLGNGIVYAVIDDPVELSNHVEQLADSIVVALKSDSGSKLWQSEPISAGVFGITLTNNVIYVVSGVSKVSAYDAQHGKHIWGKSISGARYRPLATDGMVYVVDTNNLSSSGCVTALDASNGKERWNVSINKVAEIISVTNDTVYVTDSDEPGSPSNITALKTTDGSQLWRVPLFDTVITMTVAP